MFTNFRYVVQSNITIIFSISNFVDKVKNKFGVYKATLVYEGQPVKGFSTFFPAEWSHEKVFDKICEAYKNFTKSGSKAVLQKNGRWAIPGYTKEGIKVKMNIVKIIYEDGFYDPKNASNFKMDIIGMFLARDVGCRYPYHKRTGFRDWALADKEDPNSGFGSCIGADATFLEEKEDGFIYITMDYDLVKLESDSAKISRQQLVQLLDDWQEKVCKRKSKPKEVVVKDVNGQFVIETKD